MLKTTSYPDAVIEMQNVGIRYGQGAEVLSDIKLSLKRGSFHFLTGKSGAGKTSLLSMMYLAQKPSRGIVSVFGKNVNFTNRDSLAMLRRKIGVVFQDFRLLEHLSAFDNVALPLRVCGMEEKEVKNNAEESKVDNAVGRTIADMEQELILKTLQDVAGNRTKAAEILGITVRTLRNKLNEYRDAGIDVEEYLK